MDFGSIWSMVMCFQATKNIYYDLNKFWIDIGKEKILAQINKS